jgi:anti-sigma factor RsiW
LNIMSEHVCTYAATREERLLEYLYGEIAPDERRAFDRHLTACAVCRTDLAALDGVRQQLTQWAPPEPSFRIAPAAPAPAGKVVFASHRFFGNLQTLPAWARTAAALLLFAAGLGLANLEISYTPKGLSVRTGWRHVDPSTASASLARTPVPPGTPVPWQADLAALKAEMQRAMAERPAVTAAAAPASDTSDEMVLRRVRALLQESEQRQQRELALRVAEISRDVQTQRQADLVKIERNLGLIQSRTGMEVMRTQQQVNSLAQRVSQRQ